jgi:hypothetical protein
MPAVLQIQNFGDAYLSGDIASSIRSSLVDAGSTGTASATEVFEIEGGNIHRICLSRMRVWTKTLKYMSLK